MDAHHRETPDTFGQSLARTRRAAGLTQAALARRAGVRRQLVSALEHDQLQLFRPEWLVSLADALGTDVPTLFPFHAVPSLAPQVQGARTRRTGRRREEPPVPLARAS